MYSEDPAIKSARMLWDHAQPSRRLQLLRDAGCISRAHAYRRFDELPIAIKLDLNYAMNRHTGQALPA